MDIVWSGTGGINASSPHRHDFEEMFTVLDGEIELAFRGQASITRSGETVNVSANTPHQINNVSDRPARPLCMCSPAGQEEFFREVGQPVETRTTPLPPSTMRPGPH